MKLSQEMLNPVYAYIEAHRADIMAMWKDFVDTRSDATMKDWRNVFAKKLGAALEEIGCKVTYTEVGERNGMCVDGILGETRPGKPVLFTGHYDTVPLKAELPFYVDGENRAHGLGCLDMKGGVVMAIWIAKALTAAGWAERPLRFLFVGDEENGHQFGKTKEFLVAHGGRRRLRLQYGNRTGKQCHLHGAQGHRSGGSHRSRCSRSLREQLYRGPRAITELTRKIAEMEALTDLSANTTVASPPFRAERSQTASRRSAPALWTFALAAPRSAIGS